MSFRNWLIKLLGGSPPNEKQSGKVETSMATDRPVVAPAPAILNKKTLILSSDARTIYLIDKNGKSINLDLSSNEGGTIGLIKGQLSAIKDIRPVDGGIGTIGNDDDILLNKRETVKNAGNIDLRLEVREENEYNITYNASTRSLGIAGATNINDDNGGELTGRCDLHLFSLRKQHVNFKFRKGLLLIEAV